MSLNIEQLGERFFQVFFMDVSNEEISHQPKTSQTPCTGIDLKGLFDDIKTVVNSEIDLKEVIASNPSTKEEYAFWLRAFCEARVIPCFDQVIRDLRAIEKGETITGQYDKNRWNSRSQELVSTQIETETAALPVLEVLYQAYKPFVQDYMDSGGKKHVPYFLTSMMSWADKDAVDDKNSKKSDLCFGLRGTGHGRGAAFDMSGIGKGAKNPDWSNAETQNLFYEFINALPEGQGYRLGIPPGVFDAAQTLENQKDQVALEHKNAVLAVETAYEETEKLIGETKTELEDKQSELRTKMAEALQQRTSYSEAFLQEKQSLIDEIAGIKESLQEHETLLEELEKENKELAEKTLVARGYAEFNSSLKQSIKEPGKKWSSSSRVADTENSIVDVIQNEAVREALKQGLENGDIREVFRDRPNHLHVEVPRPQDGAFEEKKIEEVTENSKEEAL